MYDIRYFVPSSISNARVVAANPYGEGICSGRCFADGSGLVGERIALALSAAVDNNGTGSGPSIWAYQIRYG
eukprot:7178870-Pyramimonas_sp.AAC.2